MHEFSVIERRPTAALDLVPEIHRVPAPAPAAAYWLFGHLAFAPGVVFDYLPTLIVPAGFPDWPDWFDCAPPVIRTAAGWLAWLADGGRDAVRVDESGIRLRRRLSRDEFLPRARELSCLWRQAVGYGGVGDLLVTGEGQACRIVVGYGTSSVLPVHGPAASHDMAAAIAQATQLG